MSAAEPAGGPPLLAKVCSMLSKSMVLSVQECVLLQEKPWELPFLAHIWVFTSEERLTLESQKPFFFSSNSQPGELAVLRSLIIATFQWASTSKRDKLHKP
jgi:hypothetical protein